QVLKRLIARWQGDAWAWREVNSDLNRALVRAAFLPHEAYNTADAIARVWYRLNISKRHLLEWQTAEMSYQAARLHLDPFRAHFFLICAAAAVFMLGLQLR